MINNYLLLAMLLVSVMTLSVVLKKLTLLGALLGGLIALCIYAGAGFTGLAMLGTFFICGTVATTYKKDWKQKAGIAEAQANRRTAGQVFANGGVAAIAGLIAFRMPQYAVLSQVMLAGILASATADTLSSELGVVFGRRFYNACTFKKDTRGLDGVVSVEGTLAGIGGSILIAFIYAANFGWGYRFIVIVIAGTLGNFADSVLGATLERTGHLNNNAVNFLNTLIGALTAGVLFQILITMDF